VIRPDVYIDRTVSVNEGEREMNSNERSTVETDVAAPAYKPGSIVDVNILMII